jgi:hypothetical protein
MASQILHLQQEAALHAEQLKRHQELEAALEADLKNAHDAAAALPVAAPLAAAAPSIIDVAAVAAPPALLADAAAQTDELAEHLTLPLTPPAALQVADPILFTSALTQFFSANPPLARWIVRALQGCPMWTDQTFMHATALQAVIRGLFDPASIATLPLPSVLEALSPSPAVYPAPPSRSAYSTPPPPPKNN